AEEVLVRSRMKPAEQRQDLVADQTAPRVAVRRVGSEREPGGAAVLLRLLPPEPQKRMDDTKVVAGLDSGRGATRDEAVQDRRNLVGGGMTGRAQALARDRIAQGAELRLCHSCSVELDDFGAELRRAKVGVGFGLLVAAFVVHVKRGNVVA